MTNNELRELIVILSEATTKRQRLGSYSVEAGPILFLHETLLKLAHAVNELQTAVKKNK
jgi:hypothetical protein